MVSFLHPKPAPPGFGGNDVVKETRASPLSKLILHWLSPILNVGFSRPLQKDDFWLLPDAKLTGNLAARVEANFYARVPPEERPAMYRNLESAASNSVTARTPFQNDKEAALETLPSTPTQESKEAPSSDRPGVFQRRGTGVTPTTHFGKQKGTPNYDRSLAKALHAAFWRRWWLCGLAKLIGDTLKTTAPLVNKELLTWLAKVYIYYRLPEQARPVFPGGQPQGIGYGIGLVFALYAMQELASLITNHYTFTSMTTGMMVRSSVIGIIFRKSLRMSGRARVDHSVGQITTMVSSDGTRLEMSTAFFHNAWVVPIQLIIIIALLINTLGYSALVGLGVIILGFPVQFVLVFIIFGQRKKGVKITDQRARLTNEILQGIRLIKCFSWEDFYAQQVAILRAREMKTVQKLSLALAAMIASITFLPILATILSFITYSLTGHDLDVAIIFTALQFFNLLRSSLLFLPIVMSTLADAAVALARIGKFLNAEESPDPYEIDLNSHNAVDVDADFAWEVAAKSALHEEKKDKDEAAKAKKREKKAKKAEKNASSTLPTVAPAVADADVTSEGEQNAPFELHGVKMTVPKGSFVAMVGRIGTGKSSVLQGIFGEMRRTRGKVVVGGSLAYVPQAPWIMNASIRDNILFGADDDEARFRAVIKACSLQHDFDVLPHGERTEIGERGINLSGGQKARVSLARAAYADADIVLLDDCLSAVDAHVSKALLENCLLSGPLASKTRILATHSLSVLSKVDHIYVIDQGSIVESGTFAELRAGDTAFAKLMEEYGSAESQQKRSSSMEPKQGVDDKVLAVKEESTVKDELMQAEERVTGAVSYKTYARYSEFAGSLLWIPAIIVLLVLAQGASVTNTLFLGFWTSDSLGLTQAGYIGIYGGLGAAIAVFSFFVSYSFSLMTISAGFSMFRSALNGVLHSPVSWFDTTPIGRIISRLSKDQDTVDQELAITMWSLASNFMMIWGTVALVFYTFPYLGIIFVPLAILYYYVGIYYRRTSVETKRMDSLMRSALYASYNETLTGVSTVRAFGEEARFIRNADLALDLENRAHYMTIAIQSWLGIRLDALGNLLIIGIGLFAVGQAKITDPSKVGVVLSYALGITAVFSEMVSSYAQNEQNMNAVERVLVYTELTAEGDLTKPSDPPSSWPDAGLIKFDNVQLSYRPDLPLVLKGVSFEVRAGEKIGIVGRTGAGKSSMIQALFRMVELKQGSIMIDGVDTSTIGLRTLRESLAFVPQDSTLFLGTLRQNLDPRNTRTDAELISALQRAWLLPRDGSKDSVAESKFSLEAPVGDDGANYSAGEKQLLALCRALVKNSRIIILDEATSNVDVETDAKLQKTIQTEFATSTLLCIAHRLNTIVYYDRILVLDAGEVAEFDTPLNLFDRQDGIFRSLCEGASLSRQDIERIRASVEK